MINKNPRFPMPGLEALCGPRFDFGKLREDTKYSGLDNPEHRPYCLSCGTFARMKPVGNEWVCDANDTDYAGRYGCGARIERTGAGHGQ